MNDTDAISTGHLAAAHAVFRSLNNRLASKLGASWPLATGAVTLTHLTQFFAANVDPLGDQPFGIKIDPRSTPSGRPLSAGFIRDALMEAEGTILVTVGSDLSIAAILHLPGETTEKTWLDHMQDASIAGPVFFFEQRHSVRVFASGGFVEEFVPSTGEKPGRAGRFGRLSLNYRDAIQEHYEEWVKHSAGCDHWEAPATRILRKNLGSAKKTEEIFQASLLKWLSVMLTDATVWPEPRKPNKDRADIKIEAFGGRFYFVEIKWMGNSGKTVRKISRLTDGIKQLKQYLEQRPCPSHATLVVYDGRAEEEFAALLPADSVAPGIKIINECASVGVPSGGSCMVLYLFSKQASEL